ncbi:MAG: hypothetical protein KTR19_12750 [Hyphomicrobiales bacterium]|nr:hypothetical protein [Hyphomicrobiales bacterium]
MRLFIFAATILLAAGQTAAAQDREAELRVYFFGNSLIHHQTSSDETTVPHWLHHLAQAAGKRVTADGQWGFLRNFEKDLPPLDQWSFQEVTGSWNRDNTAFAQAGFNTVIVNPANFIQYQPADTPYEGDNPNQQTPLGASIALVDWLERQTSGQRYFIYEGWAEMASFVDPVPADPSDLEKYHAYNIGAYHAWYEDFVRGINESKPDLDVRLIPVASVLSKLFTQTELKDLKPADLYSDSAPHGTNNTYFLAAIVTYTALFGEQTPKSFVVPDSLHALIRDNYHAISEKVCAELACRKN